MSGAQRQRYGRYGRRRALLTGFLLSLGCSGDRGESQPEELVIFAAASLGACFRGIESDFEGKNRSTDLVINLGGSQILASQLLEGARADLFASANPDQLRRVEEAGLSGPADSFATNAIVVAVPHDNPAGLRTTRDLANPGVKVILAGANVPVGRYARAALDKMSLLKATMRNVVSDESSVQGVVAKLRLGEADAGIVYATDLQTWASGATKPHASMGDTQEPRRPLTRIPGELGIEAHYGISTLHDSEHVELADRFRAHLRSPRGRAQLQACGFGLPSTRPTAASSAATPSTKGSASL